MVGFPASSSLAFRLTVTIAFWTVVALAITALLLVAAFRQNVERSFDDLLMAHAFNLMGAIEIVDGNPSGSPDLGDPRFLRPQSGWSWMVSAAAEPTRPLLFSPSMTGEERETIPPDDVPFDQQFQRRYEIQTSVGVEQRVEAQLFFGDSQTLYQVMVSGNRADVDNAIGDFIRQVLLSFTAVALGVVVLSSIAVQLGLRPLGRAREQLQRVREGEANAIAGEFPTEIKPLITEINILLDDNRSIVERSRVQVGNLAHALKTPLAVIQNAVTAGRGREQSNLIAEQAETMKRQLTNYLARARTAATAGKRAARLSVKEPALRLVRVMARLSPDKAIETDIPADTVIAMDQEDFEEAIGNLLENAVRFARMKVILAIKVSDQKLQERPSVLITVDDDGPGIGAQQRDEVLKRGLRLDETSEGSGLGLAIVRDIVEDHAGKLHLGQSPLGGLRVEILLPRLKSGTP